MVGPKPSSRFGHHDPPVSSGCAFDDHGLLLQQIATAALLLAKAGISVLNSVVGFEPAYDSFFVKMPWIGGPLRRDLLHVPRAHLVQEVRAVRHPDARGRLHRPRAEIEVEDQERRDEEEPASPHRKARHLRRSRRLVLARRARSPGPLVTCRAHAESMPEPTRYPSTSSPPLTRRSASVEGMT